MSPVIGTGRVPQSGTDRTARAPQLGSLTKPAKRQPSHQPHTFRAHPLTKKSRSHAPNPAHPRPQIPRTKPETQQPVGAARSQDGRMLQSNRHHERYDSAYGHVWTRSRVNLHPSSYRWNSADELCGASFSGFVNLLNSPNLLRSENQVNSTVASVGP